MKRNFFFTPCKSIGSHYVVLVDFAVTLSDPKLRNLRNLTTLKKITKPHTQRPHLPSEQNFHQLKKDISCTIHLKENFTTSRSSGSTHYLPISREIYGEFSQRRNATARSSFTFDSTKILL